MKLEMSPANFEVLYTELIVDGGDQITCHPGGRITFYSVTALL